MVFYWFDVATGRAARADHPELQSLSSSRQFVDGVYMMPPENAVVYASIKKGQFRTWIATKPSLSLQIGGCGTPQLRRGTTTSFYRASRRRRYRVFGAIEEALKKAAFQIPVCCGSGRGDFSSRRAAGTSGSPVTTSPAGVVFPPLPSVLATHGPLLHAAARVCAPITTLARPKSV